MRPIFLTLLFLSSFAFGQEMTQQEEAEKMVDLACKELLSNQIMESYTFSLSKV